LTKRYPSEMKLLMLLVLLVALVCVMAETHTTRLYRASNLKNLKVKRMKTTLSDNDWMIVDVVDRGDESSNRLHYLSAPGPERRWAWPALR